MLGKWAVIFRTPTINSSYFSPSSLRHDLTTISKTMAVLLAQPLSSVGSRLRELRDAQDRKKKQLLTLEARERTALKKLSGKEPSSTSGW